MNLLRRAFARACIALLLSSCGGGGLDFAINGGGGVGTGGTGIVAGTLSGLGSVIVDGVRFDDSQASLERRPDLQRSQPLSLADLQVGQYVYLDLDASGNPTRVRVESQLVGSAADVNKAGGFFTVWGQRVAINADPSRGPVTLFSGYRKLEDVHSGDPVQVYGVLQSTDSGSDVIRASRIERLSAVGALPARVTGTVHAGAGGALLLAGLPLDVSAAPSPPALAVDVPVTAVIPWSASLPTAWRATSVALLAPAASSSLRLSGAAHLLPGGGALVQGVQVDLSKLSSGDRGEVQEGSYVTLSGSASSDDGRRAVASKIDPVPQSGQSAQLRGSVTAVQGTTSFVIRGQQVDSSGASFVGGSRADIVVGRYVEVEGVQTPTGITATKITLTAVTPDNAVLDVTASVKSVNSNTREVEVETSDGEKLQLKFAPGTPLPSNGDTIRASGYWSGTDLKVRDVD